MPLQVYISGQSQGVSPDPLCNYCGGAASTKMTETAPGSNMWEITLPIPDGTPIQFTDDPALAAAIARAGTIELDGVPLDLVVLSNATVLAGGQILADGFGYPVGGDAGPGAGSVLNSISGGAGGTIRKNASALRIRSVRGARRGS